MIVQEQGEPLRWKHRPFPELARLAWPIITSLLSYSAMSLVDALFVGRLGASAIAATGLGSTAVFSVLCFGVGLLAGAKVRVSEAVGAGQRQRLLPLLGGFLRVAALLGALFVICGWALSLLLPRISADAQSGALAQAYCGIRAWSMPLTLIASALGQYRQALGDSRSAMRAALIANLVHVPLNYLLIFGLEYGVRGAACASVLCSALEAGLLLSAQAKYGFGLRAGHWSEAWQVFGFGLPTAIERWLDSAAFVALVVLIARAGAVELAAHQITLQVIHFCFLPVVALGDAVCVLVAQAAGAKEREVGRRVLVYGVRTGIVFGLVCGIVLLVAGRFILGFFSTDAVLLDAAQRVVWAAVALQLINSVFTVLKGALRGLGALRYVAWVSVGCAWVFTPPLTWLFTYRWGMGAAGGWLALTFEVFFGTVCLVYRLAGMQLHGQGNGSTPLPSVPTLVLLARFFGLARRTETLGLVARRLGK